MLRHIALSTLTLAAACDTAQTEPSTLPQPAAATASAVGTWTARAGRNAVWNAVRASATDPATGHSTLFVIGGQTKQLGGAGSITSAVKAFDVSTNTWRPRAPFPIPVSLADGATELGGKIYVAGGFTKRYDAQRQVYRLQDVATLYVYDPAADRWARKRDMPLASAFGVSAAYKGLLYVLGAGALRRYTPATDTWVELGRPPHDPGEPGGGIIGGRFYIVSDLGAVDIYDVATGTWSSGPQRPRRYCTPASATLAAKLYLVGCHDDLDASGHYPMLVFNPATNAWSEAATPPPPATGNAWTLSRIVAGGRSGLELVGGDSPGNNWQFLP